MSKSLLGTCTRLICENSTNNYCTCVYKTWHASQPTSKLPSLPKLLTPKMVSQRWFSRSGNCQGGTLRGSKLADPNLRASSSKPVLSMPAAHNAAAAFPNEKCTCVSPNNGGNKKTQTRLKWKTDGTMMEQWWSTTTCFRLSNKKPGPNIQTLGYPTDFQVSQKHKKWGSTIHLFLGFPHSMAISGTDWLEVPTMVEALFFWPLSGDIPTKNDGLIPRCCMYGICTLHWVWVILVVNANTCSIDGAYGIWYSTLQGGPPRYKLFYKP